MSRVTHRAPLHERRGRGAGWRVARSRAGIAMFAAAVLLACSDGAGPGGDPPFPPFAPIVFVSTDDAGHSQLYSLDAESGVVTPITETTSNESEPHSAAGKLVFTSDRDGNSEIYTAANDGANVQRLTTNAAADFAPALSPDGSRVAFASDRSGIVRVYVMDASGANVAALATGSAASVPEQSPAWSPDGSMIAFASVSTGTSQVFVVAAAGGTAEQVTHEASGAFEPAWTADGTRIVYTPGVGNALHVVTLGTGATDAFPIESQDMGEPACDASYCVGALVPTSGAADLVAYTVSDHRRRVLLARSQDDRQPAFLVP
ncbi:MAG TPA: hypothetical protein VFK13_07970 [Gemmatimonadaceae bacterium]|nr:hypothetical protein [Gemmatimonadaceae bacterium]